MRLNKAIMWILLFGSLATIPLIGKRHFFRFLPSATFVTLLLTIMSEIAQSRRWWKVKINLIPDLITNVSFVLSTFFVGTLWVFKYSYGKFSRYLVINVILDWLFSYPLSHLFQKLNVFKLIRFRQHHIFLTFISFSLIIYWFQTIIEENIVKANEEVVEN